MNFEKLEADVNMILNKHFTKGRGGHKIDKVVLHHNAGNLGIEGCYNVWQTRQASAHYQVQSDGKIGQLVWDSNTAWHAGDSNANMTSIGIEHANNNSNPWTISEACLDAGAHLVAAVCKYYNLGEPEWLKNVFPHSYFSPTACPGEIANTQKDKYMETAKKYYREMTGIVEKPSIEPSKGYLIRVANVPAGDVLNIRKEPSVKAPITGELKYNDPNVYTIIEENNGWGKLKSGIGWISLSYTKKVNGASGSAPATIKKGSKVKVTNPIDWNGTKLNVSGTYDVIEVKGDRVVIGKGKAVTAAIHKNYLKLV